MNLVRRSVLLAALAGLFVVPVAPASSAPLTLPYYPMGIIEISQNAIGSVSVTYSGFVPAWPQWTCAGTLSVSCTPPPPPSGPSGPMLVNVCAIVTVQVTNTVLGSVSGSSRCATGAQANATSVGPTTAATTAAAAPNTQFPWTCSAIPNQPIPGPWTVRCTVSH